MMLAMLGEETANLLIPCVGLDVYGGHLLSKGTAAMTKYGAIRRKDGLPLRAPLEQARDAMARAGDGGVKAEIVEQETPDKDGKMPAHKKKRREAVR